MNEKALRVRYQKNKVKKERWKMYDVIIIGAGVSGVAAARELSRYNAKVCVIEKEEDVCCGTSKANSATVLCGKIDAILLTGGIAYSDYVISRLKKRISFLAPIYVYPGENEMESLAFNAIGALKGELPIQTYK